MLSLAAALSFAIFARAAASAYPRELRRFERLTESAERLTESAERLRPDATIVAHDALVARFSAHTRVLDYTRLPFGTGPVTPEQRAMGLAAIVACADLVAMQDDPNLETLAREAGVFEAPVRFRSYLLFFRRHDAPRIADPDRVLQRALLWDGLSSLQRRGATLAQW